MVYSFIFSKFVLLVVAPALSVAFTNRNSISHGTIVETQLFVSDLPSTSFNTENRAILSDEADKAFLTQAISSTKREDVLPPPPLDGYPSHQHHPSILPAWVVEGHHAAVFEADGIMMTEHLEPHLAHLATPEEKMTKAVPERVARAMERRGLKPPPVYYFD